MIFEMVEVETLARRATSAKATPCSFTNPMERNAASYSSDPDSFSPAYLKKIQPHNTVFSTETYVSMDPKFQTDDDAFIRW